MADDGLVVRGGSLAALTADARTGYAGGAWNGTANGTGGNVVAPTSSTAAVEATAEVAAVPEPAGVAVVVVVMAVAAVAAVGRRWEA